MDNQTLVYELAAKYIQSGAGGNGDFNYFRDHLVSHSHDYGIHFYKVGEDGGTEYFLGCSSKGTLYKRIVRHSYRVHMDLYEYHRLIKSEDEADKERAFKSEEDLISEEIIPLMSASQIGLIGKKIVKSHY